MTSLSKAVDAAIADENRRFLADPDAIAAAQAEGDLYRRRLEGDPDAQPLPLPPHLQAWVDEQRAARGVR
jgi:hypothetical protein